MLIVLFIVNIMLNVNSKGLLFLDCITLATSLIVAGPVGTDLVLISS